MRTTKSLKQFASILLILVIFYSIISVIEIVNVWNETTFDSSQFEDIDLGNYTVNDKISTSLYLFSNLLLCLPTWWFFKICKKISKGNYYETEVIANFKKISIYLFITSAVVVFAFRFFSFSTSDSFVKPEFWFDISPVFFMFIASFFEAFAIILEHGQKIKQENELTI